MDPSQLHAPAGEGSSAAARSVAARFAAAPPSAPFAIRASILTPLGAGGTSYLDDAVLEVDQDGRIAAVAPWTGEPSREPALFDLRPYVLLPGLVDLHVHIPQIPNAGIGAGLDLLSWLDRYTLPLERRFNRAIAEAFAPRAFEAFAAAGTTTLAGYVTTDPDATDAVFEAAEAHGIRAILGLVLMDRWRGAAMGGGDEAGDPLRASARLCERWHLRDDGRLRYAFTPRFAVSCSRELMAGSARLAAECGAHWQTHLSEDWHELTEVQAAFPEARDYLDVYEHAAALGPNALFAHAIHLSDREVRRLAESGAAVAHCPASNLFLPSGIMPLARYLAEGIRVGLGSDVSGGPTLSIFETMRVGGYVHTAFETTGPDAPPYPAPTPLDWLRLGTLDGARALGLGDRIGSLEAGKEADFIAVDPSLTEPVAGLPEGWLERGCDDTLTRASNLMSRLIFRTHPEMVRAAWVRGRPLPRPRTDRVGPAEPGDRPAGTARHWETPSNSSTASVTRGRTE